MYALCVWQLTMVKKQFGLAAFLRAQQILWSFAQNFCYWRKLTITAIMLIVWINRNEDKWTHTVFHSTYELGKVSIASIRSKQRTTCAILQFSVFNSVITRFSIILGFDSFPVIFHLWFSSSRAQCGKSFIMVQNGFAIGMQPHQCDGIE